MVQHGPDNFIPLLEIYTQPLLAEFLISSGPWIKGLWKRIAKALEESQRVNKHNCVAQGAGSTIKLLQPQVPGDHMKCHQ